MKPNFSRGSVERAARDTLADRLTQNGARDPFAVATQQVRRMSRTAPGREALLRLATAKVSQGSAGFGGDDPEGDWRRTQRSIQGYRTEPRTRTPFFSRLRGRGFSRAGGRM
jgi:hypothetical protein